MKIHRVLFLPASWLYGLATGFRNWLFNKGILKSRSFDLPIISVGNLTTGGTGKTPHVEYLVRLLRHRLNVATLSRGYGRKTKGFVLANNQSTSHTIGDEPLQYSTKFKDIKVAVCEDRVSGVEQLLTTAPKTELILLDDAFQHRYIQPGLSILLTDYSRIYTENYLLPSGSLRESRKGMKRADIIIITKTPAILSPLERRRIISEIKPLSHQKVFFSCIKYGELIPTWHGASSMLINKEYYFERKFSILLVTGIAKPRSIERYLGEKTKHVQLLKFPDHHPYTITDIQKIKDTFEKIKNPNKIIITTEKDWMRMSNPELLEEIKSLKIFYLPIEITFHDNDGEKFNHQINTFIQTFHPGQSNPLSAHN